MSKQRIGVGRLRVASHETLGANRPTGKSETRSAADAERRVVRSAHMVPAPKNIIKHYVM